MDDWHRQQSLYRAYGVHGDRKDVALLFRDRELSDLIGFTYAKNAPEHAVGVTLVGGTDDQLLEKSRFQKASHWPFSLR